MHVHFRRSIDARYTRPFFSVYTLRYVMCRLFYGLSLIYLSISLSDQYVAAIDQEAVNLDDISSRASIDTPIVAWRYRNLLLFIYRNKR